MTLARDRRARELALSQNQPRVDADKLSVVSQQKSQQIESDRRGDQGKDRGGARGPGGKREPRG